MFEWFSVGDPLALAILAAAAFAAGLLDSIAGGGGLITVPVLLASGLPPAQALATNKLQSSFGSGTALFRYSRAGLVPWGDAASAIGYTAAGAAAGTMTVQFLPGDWLEWIIPGLLACILIYLIRRPHWGRENQPARWPAGRFYAVFGLGLGFYDGFLGPGTGTFWTMALAGLLGYGLPQATAQTKMTNFTSNLVSLAFFALMGQVLWGLGLLMGVCQALGAQVGTKVALSRGAGFIRWVLLAVVAATLIKLLWTALT